MLLRSIGPVLGGLLALALSAAPAQAQYQNIESVSGPGAGEETILTITPHRLNATLSARALGIKSPRRASQWVLTLIGAAPDAEIGLRLGKDTLAVGRISRPEDGSGPVQVYMTEQAFLTLADSPTARLVVDGSRVPLPEALRQEMQVIFDRAT